MRTAIQGVVVALAVSVVQADAQTVVRAKVEIPPMLTMRPLVEGAPVDTVRLKWVCGAPTPDPLLPVGRVVTRQKTVGGAVVLVQDTVRVQPTIAASPEPVPRDLSDFVGQVFVDKSAPNKLRVNPWLWKNNKALPCGGVDRVFSPASLRDVEFYYELQDRAHVRFRTRAVTFGALTVPLRFRPGYTAQNGSTIGTDVSSKVAVGGYLGWSSGRVGYNYVQYGENSLKEVWRVTLATFGSISEGSADANTSKAASASLTRTEKFAIFAPGFGAMLSVKGVEAGLFIGKEFALGSDDARKWDYHGRWWYGVGVGYQLFGSSVFK